MSNLSNNTKSLEQLLQKVNSLPDVGSGGTDTSDATASADEIFAGETAYIADGKVTGTFTIDAELNEQNDLISQMSALIVTKATPTVTEDVTDELQHGESITTSGSTTHGTTVTESREGSHELHAHGNIGVMSTQDMIKQEREIALFNLYDIIIDEFKQRFCIMVY